MRMYPREFPPGRRRKPTRQAERRIYEALASSDRRGFVYYEWRRGYGDIELDFAIWVEGVGRIALQVKGGRYRLVDGEWQLETRNGWQPVATSPLDEAWLAMLDLHDDIRELAETAYNPFVIPVVSFPDMEPDGAIEHLARRKGVHLAWRTDDLMADLETIVGSRGVSAALTMERIAREVAAVTDGLIRLDALAGGETPAEVQGLSTLRLWVGGVELIRVRAREIRLRLRNVVDPVVIRRGGGARGT